MILFYCVPVYYFIFVLCCVRYINFPILAVCLYIALVTHTVPIQYLGVVHITYSVTMSVVFVTHTVPV